MTDEEFNKDVFTIEAFATVIKTLEEANELLQAILITNMRLLDVAYLSGTGSISATKVIESHNEGKIVGHAPSFDGTFLADEYNSNESTDTGDL